MRLDYDAIAHLYDQRSRDHDVDPDLAAFLASHDPEAVRVADIGCGTGKQLAANRGRYPRLVLIGVDRSPNMLRLARTRAPSVTWIAGDAQALPLASACVDYVTSQFVYPHVRDKIALFREAFRMLRPGGRFVLQHIDPWSMPDWIVYRFFPEARDADYRDFLPVDAMTALLSETGFAGVTVTRRSECREESLREFLARGRHTASQFAAISDAAYDAGRQRVRAALGGEPDVTLTSRVALVVIRADRI